MVIFVILQLQDVAHRTQLVETILKCPGSLVLSALEIEIW